MSETETETTIDPKYLDPDDPSWTPEQPVGPTGEPPYRARLREAFAAADRAVVLREEIRVLVDRTPGPLLPHLRDAIMKWRVLYAGDLCSCDRRRTGEIKFRRTCEVHGFTVAEGEE